MINKKKFFRAMAALIIGGSFLIFPTANAEVQTYIGEGEYLMNDFETPEVAKQRAKNRAEQNAQEQAGIYLESYSHMKNFDLLNDEIITISSGIMKILDVKFNQDVVADGKGILIHVTIKAEIDSDNMDKWLNKSIEQRRQINSQMENLRQENAKQEATIADLKSQLAAGTITQEQAKQDFVQKDKVFTFYQKLQEGLNFCAAENFQQAVQSFTDAINIFPRNAYGYFDRGTAYNELHENQKALDDFNKSIEIAPNHFAYNNRGKINFEMKNFNAALEDFNKAIQVNPNDATAYYNRGTVYFAVQNFNLGMKDFDKAISLQPNNVKFYVKRSAGYYVSGKMDSALKDLNTAIKVDPTYYESYSLRGEVYTALKDYKAALKDFNKSIELNPNDAETYAQRGNIYKLLGDNKNAQKDFATAKKMGYTE